MRFILGSIQVHNTIKNLRNYNHEWIYRKVGIPGNGFGIQKCEEQGAVLLYLSFHLLWYITV